LISFRNVAELYELRNDTYFPSGMLRNFTDYTTTPVFLPECSETLHTTQQCSFFFQNVAKLYGLCNDACFEGFEGSKQGSRTDRKYSQMKLGYDNNDNNNNGLKMVRIKVEKHNLEN